MGEPGEGFLSTSIAPRLLALLLLLTTAAAAATTSLSNGMATADFNDRGLATFAGRTFTENGFALTLNGKTYDSRALPAPTRASTSNQITYSYAAAPFRFDVVYEVPANTPIVSRRILVTASPATRFQVDEIVFRSALAQNPSDVYVINRARPKLGTSDYGAALRFHDAKGLLAVVQNPFLHVNREAGAFSIAYKPEMPWDMAWGAFESDRELLAPYVLTGRRLPEHMRPEWKLESGDPAPGLDEAEVEAFTNMVRAFLLYRPTKPLNIMIGWCANDYQIDIASPEGRAEYKRILDRAAELGAGHVLFAPANSDVSRRDESTDDWGWEYVLWLGMGEKIRRNERDPATGPLPASTREMLDYARSKKLGLLAYVYPVLGFTQNQEWLTGPKHNRANLGVRSFQDWLIAALENFYKHTGISGYSFDHTFLNYEGASLYAQWYGWRRVMETLRRDIPDIVIDGRQAYQNYGPWTWLAGSYPHPTSTDEQPESFTSFPDLSIDRVSADRERYTAYRYRNYEFAPSEIVPGFITHQTPRNADTGYMPEARTKTGDTLLPFRRRDWDYLGWQYSLISSIAIAGWNNVIDMIPARDLEEFEHFSRADAQWFHHWIAFANANKDILRNTHTILGEPGIGKLDGTEALRDDGYGYVFLFNPNAQRLSAAVHCKPGSLMSQLYPLERLLARCSNGAFEATLDGRSATILYVGPWPKRLHFPQLLGAPGNPALEGNTLRLKDVRGEMGTREELTVLLPEPTTIDAVELNGKPATFRQIDASTVAVPVHFAGAEFPHSQQIDLDRPLRIPRRVFDQLEARRRAWPIPWTSEDMRSTWLAPQRLLLYIQFAEPDDRWNVTLKIDGRPVDLLKAYASVRRVAHNFVGYYADISLLSPDRDYKLELELPPGLKPGQFQGVFVENIEPEYTSDIVQDTRQ